jgi:nicotinate-nucleotide--dimethylbenzimidazole phosphoribosyltransferase
MAGWVDSICAAPSETHAKRALQRQASLTKPAGSLGHLERLAIDLAALQRTDRPRATRAPIVIFAGDHGIAVRGVSAYPCDVTVQMLHNFARGGAAISVLARELGVPLFVVDAGTLSRQPIQGVVTDKPRCGTRDFSEQAALTAAEVVDALGCGRRALGRAMTGEPDLVVFGEMGIGSTASAAAIACALTGQRPEIVVGNGSGLDEEGRERKAGLIRQALAFHAIGRPGTPVEDVLAAVGGLEIAALVGGIIASAQNGVAVLIDGFIVSVAALAATRINPSCRPWLIFSHRSAERGHQLVLEELNARAILDLGLRLGEASGAALALPVLRLACALHNGMATFAEASVSGRSA